MQSPFPAPTARGFRLPQLPETRRSQWESRLTWLGISVLSSVLVVSTVGQNELGNRCHVVVTADVVRSTPAGSEAITMLCTHPYLSRPICASLGDLDAARFGARSWSKAVAAARSMGRGTHR